MCGIVGYVGPRTARPLLLAGLEKLEYRGYDSAGISVLDGERIDAVRTVGNLSVLRAAIDQREAHAAAVTPPVATAVAERPQPGTGIGHTRWATHGRVTEENAHPHFDTTDSVHIVVNGIVENYIALKARLMKEAHRPAVFTSETDAEVIAHLVAHHYDGDLVEAVRAAYAEMRGHYAFVAMTAHEPGLLVGTRRECPLIVGQGDGEQFIASAIPAFLRETRHVQYINDDEIVVLRPEGAAFFSFAGEPVDREVVRSTGTPTRPRSRATRRSCSRRSTSRPTPSPRRSASAPPAAGASISDWSPPKPRSTTPSSRASGGS